MRTVKKGVLLAAALVIAIAAGVFVSNKNTCVYAEEAGFNTGQFGAVCQVYGDGYDKSYFKKGETPSPKLMYWWTRVSHDLLLTDAEYSFDEFADLVSENFALETDWETDLEQFFTDNSDSGEDFVYEDGVLKLQATGAGGGGTYNLEEYQSDVTEGTGRIRCLWAEDESWGKYVAEECVILLENGAITQFVPVNFMASGKEYAAAEGKSITLEAPVVYTPRG
ncbi:MAG: hypothetical protein II787_04865, partial [Lachnospiraceae bacterium]|nr:hypothetical protein [Lachnospiraceae bacterium]